MANRLEDEQFCTVFSICSSSYPSFRLARFSHYQCLEDYGGEMIIFTKRLHSQGHVKEFVVHQAGDRGWEVREEEDRRVVKRTWLHDWHRVEGAMMRFALQATQLERAGWAVDF